MEKIISQEPGPMSCHSYGKSVTTAVVVNDDPTQLNVLMALLQKEGIAVRAYQSAETALVEMGRKNPPDLIVTDLYMPGIDGWKFCRLLRSPEYDVFNTVPILVVSATFAGDEASTITAELGANAFLSSPVDGRIFIQTVRAVCSGEQTQKALRVMVVEDSKAICRLLEKSFTQNGFRVDIACTGREGFACFEAADYDIAVLDYHLPDMRGDRLLKEFRVRNPDCVCIMMTTDPDPGLALDWMKAGAAAYLRKPFDPDYLIDQCRRARRERVLLRVEDLLEDRTRELIRSREKYQNIFETLPVGIYQTTLDGEILAANPACLQFGGCPPENKVAWMSQNTLQSYCDPEQGRRFRDLLLTHGQVKGFEAAFRRWDGKVCWLSNTATLVREEPGRPAVISGSLIDITDLKKAKEKTKQAQEFLESAMMQSPSGILIAEAPSMKIRYANKAASDILECPLTDLKGRDGTQKIGFWKAFRPEGKEYRARELPLSRALVNGEGVSNEEVFLTDNRGNCKWIKVNASPIYDSDGRISAGIVIFQDTTEYKQMEKEKQQLEIRVVQAQKMESMGNLAGGIAHDFNNILFPILGRCELLLEELPEKSPEHEHVRQILKAVIRGRDIVRQILTFSRKTEHKMVPVRIQHVLKEVLEFCRSAIPSSIEILENIQEKCGSVLADPSQIHQVIMNLITNAYHAVEADGGQIEVELKETDINDGQSLDRGLAPGRYLSLTVTDTGHGIPDDLMTRIFDPYFTTKAEGKGTGLGLAVAHGIIKEHRGAIHVVSEPGSGAAFTIFLPLIHDSEKKPESKGPKPIQNGHENLLVVDDEPDVAMLEKQLLERLGYTVTMSTSSTEALEIFQAEPGAFDLVISDMSMPGMSGLQLAERLKKIRADIPIIVCSGFNSEGHAQHWESIGISGLLQKPVPITDLSEMIRTVLNGRENSSKAGNGQVHGRQQQ